jgi:hypothetical protein
MLHRALHFLQQRFPQAFVIHHEVQLLRSDDASYSKKIWPMLSIDATSGVKQRMLAMSSLDSLEEFDGVIDAYLSEHQKLADNSMLMVFRNELRQEQEISSREMSLAARVILYIGSTSFTRRELLQAVEDWEILVEIVLEAELFNTVFISYGGPDEQIVSKINQAIKKRGAKTWFFPDDAVPGDKLHRMMTNGVNSFDRVLLICSKNSLTRPGVLNEIERVLEREAREGGGDILIPITLDDFVYSDWCPQRHDIATQIRSRVITKISNDSEPKFDVDIERVITALRITR